MIIGGYFELELPKGKEYHESALKINTGRNAFEYILRAKNYKKVYLPYYTCDTMLEPINKLKLTYEFYKIDKRFRPVFDFSKILDNEVFVYTNYFGICDKQISEIITNCKNLIIDNAQAFFSLPINNIDTFYSPRKFFGIPDGAYLYTKKTLNNSLEQDISYKRVEHLVGRIDIGAEDFYKSFRKNDITLAKQPIKIMSKLTRRILESINYDDIAIKRLENFNYLHYTLESSNKLEIDLSSNSVPMVYPYLNENGSEIKKKLISNKIFVATYWPNIIRKQHSKSWEYKLANNTVFIPVDQRYTKHELKKILSIIDLDYESNH
jgi:hypothetical protein